MRQELELELKLELLRIGTDALQWQKLITKTYLD
jgi:hypothetical protein